MRPVTPRAHTTHRGLHVQRRPMTFLSLFAGIGGFDLALTRLGIRCVGQVEIDPVCRSILARHFPEVPRHDDVRTTIAWWHTHPRPAVDLICAGWPCQDVSQAGRRAGLAGTRTGLFFALASVVSALSPGWLLLENVPGLLTSNQGEDFQTALSTLDELGYGVSWRVLDARYFGVAQRRRRVLLVGCRGTPCPLEILFEPSRGQGDPAASRTATPAAAATPAAGAGAARRCDDPHVAVAATLTASYAAGTPRGDGADTLILHPPPPDPPDPAAPHSGDADPPAGRVEAGVPLCMIQGGSGFGDLWLTTPGPSYTLDTSHPHLLALPTPTGPPADPVPGRHPRVRARSISENQRGEILTAEVAASLATGGGKPGQGYPAAMISTAPPPAADPQPATPEPTPTADPGSTTPSGQAPPARDAVSPLPIVAATLTHRCGKGANSTADDGAMVIRAPHAPLPTGIQDKTPAQPTSGDRARLGHQRVRVSVRRLTPRECERLQGFPDDWTALHARGRPVSDAARYRAIGNAVAVPVIAWVGRRLLAVHQQPAHTPSRQRRPRPPLLPTADAVEVPRA